MFSTNGHKKTELNFWVMPNAGFMTRDIMDEFIHDFEKIHPNVTIRLSIHPWSLSWNRIMDMLKGRYHGPQPDILQVGTTWVATLAHLGALEKVPAEGLMSDPGQQSATIWDPGAQTDSGQDFFCVPWFIDVRVLFYRKDIFEKLNINPEILHDWKGFFKACLEIRSYLSRSGPVPQLVAPLGFPGQKPGVLMHDLAPWIWGAGGDFCNDDQSSATLDQPGAIQGAEFYFDLINQGFMGMPDNSFDPRRTSSGFFTGHYAMQFSGAWPINTFLNKQYEYANPKVIEGFDVALFPSGPKGRFTFLGGSNLGVTAGSQNQDLAWEFIRFLSEPERQLKHAKKIGALTARMASLDALFEQYPSCKKVFWDSLSHARRLPRLVELGSVEQIIFKAGTKLLGLIRAGEYNHKRLQEEMLGVKAGIDSVLSLHRYGTHSEGVKA